MGSAALAAVLLGSVLGAAHAVSTECSFERAVLRGREIPISPAAVLRGDCLFVPLSFVRNGLGITATSRPDGLDWQLAFFDKQAKFTVGQAKASGPGGAAIILPAAPYREQEQVFVPTTLLRDAFGLVMGMAQDADGLPILQLYASGAKVTAVRAGAHPDRERLVLDLDGESPFDWQCTGDQVELYLAPPADSPLPKRQVSLEGFSLKEIVDVSRTVSPDGFGLVEVNLREDCVPEVFTLTDPARIVIDIPLAAPPSVEPPPVAPPPPTPPKAGQPVWKLMHFPMQLGMMDAYVLRLSQTDPRWMIRPALATETLPHRRTVLTMVRRLGGVAGINAGYFAWEGPPVGTVVIDGEWICTPVKPYQRTCLAIDKSGKLSMGRWAFRGKVNFENHGYLRLTAINRSHYDGNELVMYTRRYGTTLEGCNLYTRIVVGEGGAITLKESQGRPVEIPEHGFVISGRARYSDLLDKVEVGEKVRQELGTEPAIPNLWCLLEGGPRNVVDAKMCNYADVERFQDDVRYGHCSRSAIGLTKNGDMLLVAVESPGRERGGLYLDEMAAIMKKLGAVQAMNWDGGGSTTVVQGDRIINRVAGDPRPVSTALVIVPR